MLFRVDLLVSPTEEIGKILAAFAHVNLGGKHSDLSTAVQIAQLALKHRKNKNGGQRIIAFVGGPLVESVAAFQKIGKQLKKNNVAIDVISIGEIEENNEKLSELVNATNSNDNSHLITVPPGVSPVNALLSSPVMHGDSGAAMMGAMGGAPGAGGDNFDMYGGIDPSMDPELAMAIRVSTEEARAEEEARMRAAGQEQAASSSSAGGDVSGVEMGSDMFGGLGAADDEDEEALIQRALEMSMRDAQPPQPAVQVAPASSSGAGSTSMEVEDEDDVSACICSQAVVVLTSVGCCLRRRRRSCAGRCSCRCRAKRRRYPLRRRAARWRASRSWTRTL